MGAKKQIAGVSGVLGNLISDSRPAPDPTNPQNTEMPTPRPRASSHAKKTRARLGRPPGRQQEGTIKKEKFTVRVEAQLANAYRDWSWEAHCQLGELVEWALRDYLDRQRKR